MSPSSHCTMGFGSAHHVLVLAVVAACHVAGLTIEGDPIPGNSASMPSIVIHVWGNVGATEKSDIETNTIPQKNKTPTLRKLIPNYDFPVVAVVKGKAPARSQHVVHLWRRPPRPLGWSWRVWVRGGRPSSIRRYPPRFEVDGKLGPLSGEEGLAKTKEVVIDGKLGGEVEEETTTTTRRAYTPRVRILGDVVLEEKTTRPPTKKNVEISDKLGEEIEEEVERVKISFS